MKKNYIEEENIKKNNKMLRVINWALSIALIFGSLIMVFKATQIGTLYLLFFLLVTIGAYTIPAILLYPGTSKILGMPIILDKENKLLYKISIGANFLFLILGVGIILASVYTGQFTIVILGFIFTLLSYYNVKALDFCVKELNDV